jgi:hypothetical protein
VQRVLSDGTGFRLDHLDPETLRELLDAVIDAVLGDKEPK